MNTLVSKGLLPQIRLVYSVRNAGYWNKDWQPGPYPVTEEQRKAAAKKYNLLPEEYEPIYSGDGIHEPGDYPKLPDVSEENKDIYYPWDLPDERRNFGEPMHYHAIFYTSSRKDTHTDEKFKYTPWTMFAAVAGFVTLIFSFKLGDCLPWFPPVTERQFPKQGVIHYSYDPE